MSMFKSENNLFLNIDVNADSRNNSRESSRNLDNKSGIEKVESSTLIETDLDSFPYLYFRRWPILIIFCLVSVLNVFHLNLYGDLQSVIIIFYKKSLPNDKDTQYDLANWLSIIHMVINLIFILPAMFLLDFKGFRVACLIGVALTCFGSWIKLASVKPDLFPILVTGQVICGIAQAFIQSSLVKLSAVWFGKNEVATAIGIGIASNRIGNLIAFLLPPYFISKNELMEKNEISFYYIYFSASVLSTVLLFLAVFLIKNQPLRPPSLAQCELRKNNKTLYDKKADIKFKEFIKSVGSALANRNFILILISNGIILGAYFSMSTLLNQILYESYPEESSRIGMIELILICSGILGAFLSGLLLDYSKAFKLTLVLSYVLTFFSMLTLCLTLKLDIWFPFLTVLFLGFFSTAYSPIGYEYAVEITYPTSEGTSCGLLNMASMVSGIIFIYLQGFIAIKYGSFYGNLFLSIFLFVGLIASVLIQKDLKRNQVYESLNVKRNSVPNKKQTLSLANN